nr:hypothetical protein [Mesorhizobium amorphae]
MLHVKPDLLRERFDMQRRAFASEPFPSLAVRKDRLKRLQALTENHEQAICEAIDADFGSRSAHETRFAELFVVRAGINHALSHVAPGCAPAVLAPAYPFCRARTASCLSLSAWSASFHRGTIRSSSLLPRQRQRSRPATGC